MTEWWARKGKLNCLTDESLQGESAVTSVCQDRVGITERHNIGFLIWEGSASRTEELGLGSRLKTPLLPVWVTCVVTSPFNSTVCVTVPFQNNKWGVLFNPRPDLMKTHSAENR